jgi:tetratricopeptide (TPR) repeat protein
MTRTNPIPLLTLLMATAPLARPIPAAAQDSSSLAMPIFEAGQAYYKQGDYDKALEQFEEAYRLQPLPELLYNIGQCHERLQDLPAAIEAYERYLEKAPEAEDRQAVEEKIKKLKEKLAQTGIVLNVSEDGAEVFVDDELVAVTPVEEPIRTKPGTHRLKVKMDGFQTAVMKFTVPPGLVQEIQVTLVALPKEPDEEEEPEEGKPVTWFWWTFGVSAAAGAAAVVTGSLALVRAGQAGQATDPARYDSQKKTATRLAISTDVLIGVTAVGVIVSTAGAIAAAKKRGSVEDSAKTGPALLVPLVSPELAGLAVTLSF